MLIKNDWGIGALLQKRPRFAALTQRAFAALLFAVCALLSVSRLNAQDMLLKEYIYLDGRLLAVERQIVGPIAQLPVADAAKQGKTESALQLFFNRGKASISGIQGAPAAGAHFGSISFRFSLSDSGPCRFTTCGSQALNYGAFRLSCKMGEIRTNQDGGDNGDI